MDDRIPRFVFFKIFFYILDRRGFASQCGEITLYRITDNDSIEFARVNYDHRGCDQ